MRFKPVFYVIGVLLLILATAMLAPLLADVHGASDDWQAFLAAQMITGFVGLALIFMNREKSFQLHLRETCVLASVSWLFIAAFGALPFCLAEMNLDYTQAFFESMSGITTTGSTVISGLDNLPHGILLWRIMLQWLGGIGFLVTALTILPMLQISGMQIFKTHALQIEKVMPSATQLALSITAIYGLMTVVCTGLLSWTGVPFFEAVCHAMSAISTGGFSTSDVSAAHFSRPMVHLILMVFMILGSLPFVLYLRLAKGDFRALARDSQVRAFLATIFVLGSMLTAYLVLNGQQYFMNAVQNAFFTIVSLITTTGLTDSDYSLWGPFAGGLVFVAMFLGGCSGSAAGGMKIFRLQILWLMLRQQTQKVTAPHGLFQVRYNGKLVDPDLQASVGVFFFVFILGWAVTGLALQLTGLDFVSAYSAAVTALSNVGPGIGVRLGPAGNFASLSQNALWVLSAAMLMGRLEFMTILVILAPRFWRD
ncbi:MAG: potassium transporter TrkH [Alphaproteobacteria bacterium]|nr:potassium transporter TrkH [Alphaproteobacteria bacterium]